MPFYYAFCNQKLLKILGSIHRCKKIVVKKVMAEKISLSKRFVRRALQADIFFTGTNALISKGQLVNLDMIGNRVSGIAWGPRRGILTIGTNKIVEGLDQAMARVRQTAAPLNAKRLGASTPCAQTGECIDCNSPHRICNVWSITEKSWPAGRISVVLIKGEYGL